MFSRMRSQCDEDPCTVFFNVLATSDCKSLSDNHVSQSENRILTIRMDDRVLGPCSWMLQEQQETTDLFPGMFVMSLEK